MGWTSPYWFTEPVTAMYCRMGLPERLESSAYNSVDEAESPSIPP